MILVTFVDIINIHFQGAVANYDRDKDKDEDDVSPKGNVAKERRSLRDPSSVLDQLGIVVLEVTDKEGLPRIEITFHPKRSLVKKIHKKEKTLTSKSPLKHMVTPRHAKG